MLSHILLALAVFLPLGHQDQGPDTQEEISLDSLTVQDTLQPAPIAPDRAEADRRLREELAATFDRIPGLEGVEPRVEAGVVFLNGRVLTAGERALADSLARRMAGVLYVDNRVAEETSIGARLRPVLERLQGELFHAVSYLPLILVAGVVIGFFLILARVIYRWEPLFRRLSRNPFLQNLLRQAAGVGVGLLGVVLALELLDATALVGAVLGAAGVVGIAVGFAFRNIAENYLAGIILSIRQPFSPDDQILVEGQEGKVIRLTSRETLLMTLDGNHLRIPNATIFNSVVQNYTRNPLRRFRFDLSVGQSEDLTRVQKIGLSALRMMKGTLGEPPPRVVITDVGDSWVMLRFSGWIDQRSVAFDKARSEAIRVTKEALDAENVAMPAPEYGLRVLDGGESLTPKTPDTQDLREGRAPPIPAEPEPTPASYLPTDLTPDRALDDQIAKDREEALERDLLKGSS